MTEPSNVLEAASEFKPRVKLDAAVWQLTARILAAGVMLSGTS
jgi:hypothetical protein